MYGFYFEKENENNGKRCNQSGNEQDYSTNMMDDEDNELFVSLLQSLVIILLFMSWSVNVVIEALKNIGWVSVIIILLCISRVFIFMTKCLREMQANDSEGSLCLQARDEHSLLKLMTNRKSVDSLLRHKECLTSSTKHISSGYFQNNSKKNNFSCKLSWRPDHRVYRVTNSISSAFDYMLHFNHRCWTFPWNIK